MASQKQQERGAAGLWHGGVGKVEGRLTGKGAVSEARVAGHGSCWDGTAGGWDSIGKHHPEGKSRDRLARTPASAPSSHLATHK